MTHNGFTRDMPKMADIQAAVYIPSGMDLEHDILNDCSNKSRLAAEFDKQVIHL